MADKAKPKFGAGHAHAMFRLGLQELRGSLYPESNVSQPTPYGIYGTKTPGEVADERKEDARVQRLNEEPGLEAAGEAKPNALQAARERAAERAQEQSQERDKGAGLG